jgi:hypothetical protein
MDDLVVYSSSLTEHLGHLAEVFNMLEMAQGEISFLRHLVYSQGVKNLPERVEAIRDFPTPGNLNGVQRFLGMAGFYGSFIKHFSSIAEPLHALKRKDAKFIWDEVQQSVFERLKEVLSTPSVLQSPDFSREFALVCDASDAAVSAVLNQRQGEELAPIAYSSRLLSPAEEILHP